MWGDYNVPWKKALNVDIFKSFVLIERRVVWVAFPTMEAKQKWTDTHRSKQQLSSMYVEKYKVYALQVDPTEVPRTSEQEQVEVET